MAKAIGRASASSPKKKPRHSAAQKKAAAQKRAQAGGAGPRWPRAERSERRERPTRSERRPRPARAAADRRTERWDRSDRREGDYRPERRVDGFRAERGEGGYRSERRDSWERPQRGERRETFGRGPSGRGRDDRPRGRRFDADRSLTREREHPVNGHDEAEEALAAETARQEALRASRPVAAAEAASGPGFAELGVADVLVNQLRSLGIATPFPIQTATIPDALAGRDVLGRGQTGSGKTLAFGLPVLQRLDSGERARPGRPRAVIMTPTRELAMQIVDALRPLLAAVGLRHQLVAGGMSYTPQLKALEQGVDVLVATPGRLTDLVERGAADLSAVDVIVLDEADHMSEMGFFESITALLDQVPAGGQRLLFSATLDHGVGRLVARYLTDPVTHSTDDATASVATMEHHVFLVHPHEKKAMTAAIANREGRTVIFVRTKLGADRVAEQLRESGVWAAALHGGLNQAARTRVLGAFKAGDLPVLVATDVAARGIHVDDVSLVLQVDPPADHKDYLHRSGRTARAGDRGVVVTLALPHQKRMVTRLMDSAGVDTAPRAVGPEDHAVLRTAGGRMPSGEAITQARLDALLRPKSRPRSGGPGRGGQRRFGGPRQGRPQRSGGYRRER